jgi:hypothetical protein
MIEVLVYISILTKQLDRNSKVDKIEGVPKWVHPLFLIRLDSKSAADSADIACSTNNGDEDKENKDYRCACSEKPTYMTHDTTPFHSVMLYTNQID